MSNIQPPNEQKPKPLLNSEKRQQLLDKVSEIVSKKFYHVGSLTTDWRDAVERNRERIVNASSDEDFERAMLALLGDLKASHVGFYHEGLSRSSSKMVLAATYMASTVLGEQYWTFQDVHAGGPAALGGIRPGDVLLSVDGRSYRPPEHPLFAVDSRVSIRVLTNDLKEETKVVEIPPATRKRGQLPQVYPSKLVICKRLRDKVGYLRIAMYPGVIGTDIANEISLAAQNLGEVERLIIDLRGNTGGGIGVLRAMSLLVPDKRPVGRYSGGGLTPVNGAQGYHFVLDRIPANLIERILLAIRFVTVSGFRKAVRLRTPVVISTEGLGEKTFHRRIVLLVDRHTASANEMLIAFACEHNLVSIVGEPTPGRVLSGNKFSLGHGYWLALPVGQYKSKEGDPIEGKSIEPDIAAPFDPEAARAGMDTQLDRALEVVLAL